MPWTASILFATGGEKKKKPINTFKYNQIREPTPDNPEPIQRTNAQSYVPLEASNTKFWIRQVQSEKENY